ncbi:MAG: PD40 domain-containing protein [Armatimonadetes bacterium]|nr:PD40 domain-containing protein [Armatimonadota bacterium]
MKLRPDLLDERSPDNIQVVQLTSEVLPSSHVYMEAQVFAPDSKRFILHRSAHAHGSDKHDPEHRYLVCDLENDCALYPITEETGATAPSVTPDGTAVYYFVNETEVGGGRLILKRVGLDGTGHETVLVVDNALPGTPFRPSSIYPLSTISSDGRKLALSAYFGDGKTEGAPWGLMVFDLIEATVTPILHGQTWCNLHPQYSRSLDPERRQDLLIQENHDNVTDVNGNVTRLVGGMGADIHVIREDGTHFRTMPWGRDGNEFCQGHQCWRGRTDWVITSTGTRQPEEWQLIEGLATEEVGHRGKESPNGVRNDLSREFPAPRFCHFATDLDGNRFITDAGPFDSGGHLFVAEFGGIGVDPLKNFTYLLNARCSCSKDSHLHPFLAPDGKTGFFNSDESGTLQAYMVRVGD